MGRTRVLQVDRDTPDPEVMRQAAEVLRHGGLVAFATETVYGLGADATNPAAVQRIFRAKGRPSSNPLIVHIANAAQARELTSHWTTAAERLATLWPGPLTLVLPKASSVPSEVTAGRPSVALRVPVAMVAQDLITAAGRPLAAPSANRSEHVSPTRAEHVLADLEGRIDMVLDSGPTSVGIESTVVDLCDRAPRILRWGPLLGKTLEEVLGEPIGEPLAGGPSPRSPGQHPRHYAPHCPAFGVDSLEQLAIMGPGNDDIVVIIGHGDADPPCIALPDPQLAARQLYAVLRHCDARRPSRILVVMPPHTPPWRAIRDRLWRATQPGVPGAGFV